MDSAAHSSFPSLDAIRAEFPSITGERASGDLFFDAAGGSQTPRIIAERITDYLSTVNVQLGAETRSSLESGAIVQAAHEWLGTWAGAHAAPGHSATGHSAPGHSAGAGGETHAVLIGSSASTLLSMIAAATARAPIEGRDEIIVGVAGHESNLAPWLRLESTGYTLRWWDADPVTGASSLSALADLVTERTRIVAIHHVSNLTGVIEDLEGIVRVAHAQGAAVVADGVAYAPHRLMEVARWGVDAYAFSLYKVFGPELAALAATRSFLGTLDPPNHDFARGAVAGSFELGGASRMGCAGALAVGEYFAFLSGSKPPLAGVGADRATVEAAYARIEALEAPLTERLLRDFARRPTVRVLGAAEGGLTQLPTISFVVRGWSSKEVARRAGRVGLGIRAGHFYAYRLTEHLGLDPADGAVRISLVHTNHPSELDRWESFLDTIAPLA